VPEEHDGRKVELCVIVGSGCAGLTAAVYAARGRLNPLVIEGDEVGGQLFLTSTVENFPGFPDGIEGPELIGAIRRQAERFGARYLPERVARIDLDVRPFRVNLDGAGQPVLAHSLIIASGARARMLGLPGEVDLLGHGLSTCATCDGAFFSDQVVAVVGGGDSAMEDAIYLTKFASEVHLVHRRQELRASKIMQERALANPKVHWHLSRVPVDLLLDGEGGVRGLSLRATDRPEGAGKATEELACSGVFYAIGHDPNTAMVGEAIPRDAQGYLTAHGVRSDVPGVFIAGDVADHRYQQAITAAGTGCAAAMEAEDWLEAEGLLER
jgi:thioredoxin reductase (NADPH)